MQKPETTERSGRAGGKVPCPRCEQLHDPHPAVTRFERPVVDQDGTIWTHWWTCPQTGDPVYSQGADPTLAERATGLLAKLSALHAVFVAWDEEQFKEESAVEPTEGLDAYAEQQAATFMRIADELGLI